MTKPALRDFLDVDTTRNLVYDGVQTAFSYHPAVENQRYRLSCGEYETHFNILNRAPSFRVIMDPETGVFNFQVGKAKIPAYPVFQALGVGDDEMAATWGRSSGSSTVRRVVAIRRRPCRRYTTGWGPLGPGRPAATLLTSR